MLQKIWSFWKKINTTWCNRRFESAAYTITYYWFIYYHCPDILKHSLQNIWAMVVASHKQMTAWTLSWQLTVCKGLDFAPNLVATKRSSLMSSLPKQLACESIELTSLRQASLDHLCFHTVTIPQHVIFYICTHTHTYIYIYICIYYACSTLENFFKSSLKFRVEGFRILGKH